MKVKFLKSLLFPILGVSAIAPIAITSTSCGNDNDGNNIAVTSVKIDKNDLIFSQNDIGKTRQLHATVLPENASNKNLIWSSSDPDVATVDSFSGQIAILKEEGTAEITVKSQQNEEAKDIGTISFVIAPTQISVTPSTIDLPLGQSTQLVATIEPRNADNKTVTWSTSSSSISLEIEDGKDGSCTVTAKGRPNNKITVYAATYNGHFATCEVTITSRE